MSLHVYNPKVFQGSLKKKRYFEGWYFKHVTDDLRHTIAVIPGISLAGNDPHAFIQVMDGASGSTEYFRYPASEFCREKRKLFLQSYDNTVLGS